MTKRDGVNSSVPRFCLEATREGRNIAANILGVVCITEYNNEQILLKTHGGKIRLVGEDLFLKVYEDKTVEIRGKVKEIGFDYAKG
jgi:hypothetical protein